MQADMADPKGLIRESYRIEGIGTAECRSILIDWALSLGPGVDTAQALRAVLADHGPAAPDHPMTAVLQAGLDAPPTPRRRGGRAARVPQPGQ
ncbi:MAG: hypothetical protein IE927_14080 [Rhodobacterales bacterium]|nr:hypothetical protein [Rhodobacterales bacterium]